jgi:hypothetical protein
VRMARGVRPSDSRRQLRRTQSHNGEQEWTTQGKVIEADPGRAFAFECSMMDLRPESVLEFSARTSGIDDRTGRNRETMRLTLERISAALQG